MISLADFERLPGGGRRQADALAPAADALARGECIRLPVEPKRVKATAAALRKLATARSVKVEIRSGPDYVAARNAGPLTKGPTQRWPPHQRPHVMTVPRHTLGVPTRPASDSADYSPAHKTPASLESMPLEWIDASPLKEILS